MVTRPSWHDYGVLMKEGFLLTVPSLGLDRVGLKGGRSELPDSSQRYKKKSSEPPCSPQSNRKQLARKVTR